MKIEKFQYENVHTDGKVEPRGAVEVNGFVRMGFEKGCGLSNCKCSSGFWLSVCLPRTKNGVVEGIKVTFDNAKEFEQVINPTHYFG